MTKREFLSKIPDLIEHKPHGEGLLEIVVDKDNHKGVCYRHRDNTASFGTYSESWQGVYDIISPNLKKNGYV